MNNTDYGSTIQGLSNLGMGRFNRSVKNDLKNVLKNREERFRFFEDSFQYKNRLRLNRPNSGLIIKPVFFT
jgi:hypothetical protein